MERSTFKKRLVLGLSATFLAVALVGVSMSTNATTSVSAATVTTTSATSTISTTTSISTATTESTASSTVSTTNTTTTASSTSSATTSASTSSVPHDARYFSQTGFRIDNDTIWDYFNRRGGITTFGYPTSRTFVFQGFSVQFFQRRVVQLDQQGHARLLNLLDPGIMPYTHFNGSTFPGVDNSLVATSPSPTDQPAVLAWVQAHAPNSFNGAPVNFYATFSDTVSIATAFPSGGLPSLLPGIELEMWGVPTSSALVDPHNHGFIYLRWQRGIMMYDASCNCTQGILLADYLKDILTGQHLPADLAQEAADSPFLNQYDPSATNWVRNPSLLPDTDLTNAFTQE